MVRSDSDFAWLVEKGPELFQKYRGKWIAVRQGKVIGVGDTATEAACQADLQAPDGDYILEAIEADADTVYAGF